MSQIIERDKVIDCIDRLFIAVDEKNWHKAETCLADSIKVDMSSMEGGSVEELTPQELCENWKNGLSKIQYVHHQSGNYMVDIQGEFASAFCYGTAYHYNSGEDYKIIVGSYDFELESAGDAWRISFFKFNFKFEINK